MKMAVSLFRAIPSEELKKRSFTHDFGLTLERLPYGKYGLDYLYIKYNT